MSFPKCLVCEGSLTLVDFIKREEKSHPVWICFRCSQKTPKQPKVFVEGIDAKEVTKEEMESIRRKLKEILEKELRKEPLDTAYEGDFEGSYTYYDDEDSEEDE